MKIQIFKDNTISINLEIFCKILNWHCDYFEFIPRKEQVHFKSVKLNNPESYDGFSKEVEEAIKQGDENYFATSLPYDNNFFL